MNLELDPAPGEGYSSRSQWARRVTEAWAERELFCWACRAKSLASHRTNTAVEDYHCLTCARRSQLKAKNGQIGGIVRNSAYDKKIAAIRANRAPDYVFLGYDSVRLTVHSLFVIPGFFITANVIERAKPLRETARRAGWVGSNILVRNIPEIAKVRIVHDGIPVAPAIVRRAFSEIAFAANYDQRHRGWLRDVLGCLDDLGVRPGSRFHVQDVYAGEDTLARRHPANHNVRPKIRQQLQLLVREGVLQRVQRGVYRRA